jgi:hypothetical protein
MIISIILKRFLLIIFNNISVNPLIYRNIYFINYDFHLTDTLFIIYKYIVKHYFINHNLLVIAKCIMSPLIILLKWLIYKLIFLVTEKNIM